MNLMAIAAYGLFALLVGANGNGPKLLDELSKDSGGFLPWAISIAVIAVVWEIPQTRKLATPFLTLAVLSFVLKNWTDLESQFSTLQKEAKK